MRIRVRVIDHEPGIKDTAVGDATLLEFAHDGQNDLLLDHRKPVGRNNGRRAVGAHAAGVRAPVAVEDALVVLRTRQQDGVLAVNHREDGTLFSVKELLDQDLRAGGAELVGDEHVVDRGLGVRHCLGDDNALAGGQSVRLDDNGQPE